MQIFYITGNFYIKGNLYIKGYLELFNSNTELNYSSRELSELNYWSLQQYIESSLNIWVSVNFAFHKSHIFVPSCLGTRETGTNNSKKKNN